MKKIKLWQLPEEPDLVTMDELERVKEELLNHPLYDPTLDKFMDIGTMMVDLNYVVYARDVEPPMEDLEPGSMVPMDYDGMRAKWIDGVVYIRKENLGKK